MDDKQIDITIIEASALLVTLIFIILSFYSSYYAQWYGMWQQRCTANPQECYWPPYMAEMSAFVGSLTPFCYLIGFFFMVSASAALLHLFMAKGWGSEGLQLIEFIFFLMGLVYLGIEFLLRAPRDVNGLLSITLITLLLIVGLLAYAYVRRNRPVTQPL